jgi:phosphoglycerate-specific signal transduction histidine kinase
VTPSPSPRNRSELINQLAVASIGAGIVTSLAVAQGQSPLTALSITLFSAIAAVMAGQLF